jgi:hypothetical protein
MRWGTIGAFWRTARELRGINPVNQICGLLIAASDIVMIVMIVVMNMNGTPMPSAQTIHVKIAALTATPCASGDFRGS